MLYVQGALNANSRFTFKSWKSQVSNAENPSAAKNSAKPKKPKQTQLRETYDSATESRPKLGLENFFHVMLSLLLINAIRDNALSMHAVIQVKNCLVRR
jgi:hypothetical protein